jgi:hypothetical protein
MLLFTIVQIGNDKKVLEKEKDNNYIFMKDEKLIESIYLYKGFKKIFNVINCPNNL